MITRASGERLAPFLWAARWESHRLSVVCFFPANFWLPCWLLANLAAMVSPTHNTGVRWISQTFRLCQRKKNHCGPSTSSKSAHLQEGRACWQSSPQSLTIARNSELITMGEKYSAEQILRPQCRSNNCLKCLCYLVPNKKRKYSDLTKLFAVYFTMSPQEGFLTSQIKVTRVLL